MKHIFAVILRLGVLALAYFYTPIKDFLCSKTTATFLNETWISVILILVIGVLLALTVAKFSLSKIGKIIVGIALVALAVILGIYFPNTFMTEYVLLLVMATYIGNLIFS